MLLELEESNRQRLAEAAMEEAELQEDVSKVSEILVDPDLAFSETHDQNRINNWVHVVSTADLHAQVTTAELENFPINSTTYELPDFHISISLKLPL